MPRKSVPGQAAASDVGVLYDRFAPELYRYLYHRLGMQTLAEDLTAEVFLRVLRMERAPNNWRAYLYRVAHNLVIDYLRRNPNVLTAASEHLAAEQNDPVERAEWEEERRYLRRAIARLTPDQQQVIVLKYIEELSISEVAEILGKPEGAVKALQHRALMNLREWLTAPPAAAAWSRWNESV